MLHTSTVTGETLKLLKELMQDEKMKNFYLAGETALSLYMGHRKSIDLDLFSPKEFDNQILKDYLVEFYNFQLRHIEKNTLKGIINGVQVDCITHKYPISKIEDIDGIRLYSIEDIAAMKLSAIANNGTRLKDFIDIAYLSSKLSLNEMLNAYENKYINSPRILPMKGLGFYNDINFKEPINLKNGKFDWKIIEKRLSEMAKHENKVFPEMG
ncbi:hypothetical protein FACS1894174_04650 [Bacteroidia bacterium]|nr:hypothetical protein FACS1894174_04650 [Bacteroidia bacterium]